MTTDEPASPLPSASLPTTPSSMRASYTIGTKSHSYTPPAKSSSLSRSNSAKILHPTAQDILASGANGVHERHGSSSETPSLTKATDNNNEAATGEAAVEVSEQQDSHLVTVTTTTTTLVPALDSSTLTGSSPSATPPEQGQRPSSFATGVTATASELSGPVAATASSSPKRASIVRAASMKQQQAPPSPNDPVQGMPPSSSLSRHASLNLNSRRKADRDSMNGGLSLSPPQQQQLPSPSPSPQTPQGPRHHRMLNRQSLSSVSHHSASTSISSSVGLADENTEDHVPGTPTSISSFSSLSSEREKGGTNGRLRSNRNSVALIENRNIHALSSNLAMIESPTKSEFGQPSSEELLSVIAQKEARIQQLREDLETNLQELSQLKEQWSKMMIEERNRQQAEANASIQQEGGGGVSSLVSNRLSTAAIWGTVVGSVSQLSGASSGLSIHHISTHTHVGASHSQQGSCTPNQSQNGHAQSGLTSGRSSTSSIGRTTTNGGTEGASTSNASRPTSPLPAYLSGFSGLHGTTNPSSSALHIHHTKDGHHSGLLLNGHQRKGGDRTSFSSQSTVSSVASNAGDVPTAFEPGHSHTSSISSSSVLSTSPSNTFGPNVPRDSRERQRPKRESSGLFIPVEAEEVIVNTGRALVKGFGSLIGGIRTVVNDVTESDRFQHSRQRTMDMVNGLAQTAADVLPLPSQDDIYYHHQRLHLLDEEEEEAWRQQQKEKHGHDQQQQKQQHGDRSASPTLRRSSSSNRVAAGERGDHSKNQAQQKELFDNKSLNTRRQTASENEDDTSKVVDILGIHDAPKPSKALSPSASSSSLLAIEGGDEDEEAHNWDIGLDADQDLLKMLDTSNTMASSTTTTNTAAGDVDLLNDTPLLPSVAASKKND